MARITETEREARRKGKKISVYYSDACPGSINTFDIRLTDKDRFTAEYLGEWYEAATIPELKELLDAEVKQLGPQTWDYYIEVDEVDFEEKEHRPRYWSARAKIKIEVNYKVIKLSNVITPTGTSYRRGSTEGEAYRLKKNVTVDGKDGSLNDDPDQSKMTDHEERTLIPYTRKRWDALEAIAASARELGRRMAEMLNGAKAAAFLDDRALPTLLALPAPSQAIELVPTKKPRKAGAR